MSPLHAVWRTLSERCFSPLKPVETWVARLQPSDWLVIAILGSVMFLSAGAMLAAASVAFSTEVPAQGGTWTEGLVGSPRFVNPVLAISETDRDLAKLVFSGLLKQNADGTLSPDVAGSYAVSDDQLTYTFTIRPDAIFQDGSPVTADDVVFTIHAIQNPETKSPLRANWEGVTVTAEDPKTVSFTLKSPYAPFIENTTVGILPSALWRGISTDAFPFVALNTEPVGAGPYAVERVHRSPSGIPTEYRLKNFSRGIRVPFIERIVFKFYENADILQEALAKGEVEAAHSIAPETARKTEAVETVFGRIFGIFFNQSQNELFAEKPVRAALDAAVDKRHIVDTLFGGYGSVIDGPLPLESTATILPPEPSPEERIRAARAILTDAGWTLAGDGVFEKRSKKKTKRLLFSLSTANVPELKRAAEMAANDWRRMGAEVTLKFFEQNDLSTEVIRPRKYDALLFGLVVGGDIDLFAFWHSSQRNDPGLNIALYANIDVDKKLERARAESDLGKRREIVSSAAKIIQEEHAAVFLYTPHFVYLVPKEAGGIELGIVTAPSDRFANVSDWYLARERVWPFFIQKN